MIYLDHIELKADIVSTLSMFHNNLPFRAGTKFLAFSSIPL